MAKDMAIVFHSALSTQPNFLQEDSSRRNKPSDDVKIYTIKESNLFIY
jgi:hypothetical protein